MTSFRRPNLVDRGEAFMKHVIVAVAFLCLVGTANADTKTGDARKPQKRTKSAQLSPAGRGALSRAQGSGRPAALSNVEAYAGPPVDHRPIQAIRTPPLRKVHPLPPP